MFRLFTAELFTSLALDREDRSLLVTMLVSEFRAGDRIQDLIKLVAELKPGHAMKLPVLVSERQIQNFQQGSCWPADQLYLIRTPLPSESSPLGITQYLMRLAITGVEGTVRDNLK